MTQKEKKEPHWFFRIIIGAIITIIVLPFLLYIALQVSKIPQIRKRQLNQEGKIATISANLIDLSYKLKSQSVPKTLKI